MTEETINTDERVRKIAEVAHQINNAYRCAIGETSRPPYHQMSDAERARIEAGVMQHLMNEHGIPPQAAHNLWMTYKLKDGWKYGEKYDLETKTHPCILPYESLPVDQRVKDYLFAGIVQALKNW